MIRFLKYLALLFLSSITILSARFNVLTDQSGISIIIDSVAYKTSLNSEGHSSIRIQMPEISLLNTESIYNVDEIRIMMAIPEDSKITYRILSEKQETIPIRLEIKNNSLASKKELMFSTELIEVGHQRGIREILLRIQPYTYKDDILTFIKELSIRIDFGIKYYPAEKSELSELESCFFDNISNPEILPFLINNSKNNKTGFDNQLNNDWYNPSQEYLRISTKKDGIALIKFIDILSVEPSIIGKDKKFYHLLYGGKEVPVYFLNNTNSVTDVNDTLLFFGRRSYGDTTWFDNYADESVFYLYLDESNVGIRFNKFPDIQAPINEIKSVRMFSHIERDKTYHRGFPQESSETAPGEGWWWAVISPSMGWENTLSDTLILFPSQLDQTTDLSLKFVSCVWNPNYEYKPLHNLSLFFNNQLLNSGSYYFRSIDSIGSSIQDSKLLPGMNKITIRSNPVYNDSGNAIEPNEVGIDYYTYANNSLPYAQNGIANFSVNNILDKSLLKIPGFTSSFIIAIDTVNNLITKVPSTRGYFSSVSVQDSLSSIVQAIGDNVFSEQRGIHVSTITNSIRTNKFFATSDNNAIDYIKQIPQNSLLSIAINTSDKISPDLVNYIKSLGSVKINKQIGNDNWVLTGIIGKTIIEDYSQTGLATVKAFLPNDNGTDFEGQLNLPLNYSSTIVISDNTNFENAGITMVNTSNLKSKTNQANAVVVYHNSLKNSALNYMKHRSETNNISMQAIDVEDIYKEFYYGRKSPHAIKQFLNFAYNSWNPPKLTHLVIWGDASWDVRKIEKGSIYNDLVSTYGWPGSDYWYARLDGDYLPELKVGRVPAKNDEEGQNYVYKLITRDSIDDNPWMKKFVMISGGQTEKEISYMYDFAKYTYSQNNIAETDLCADTVVIKKAEPSNTSESQGSIIQKEINKGVEWFYYIGHGSSRVFDLDGWQVEKLNNKGKYGFLATLACNTTAFPEPSLVSRSEEYMLYKDKGFIGSSGSTAVSFEEPSLNLGLLMLQALTNKDQNVETYVDAMWYAKSKLIYNIYDSLTSDHYTYLGDPLIKLKMSRKPDFYFLTNDLKVTNQSDADLISSNDSIKITILLYNLGPRLYKNIKLRLIHEYNGIIDSTDKTVYGICYPVQLTFFQNVIDKPGNHSFKLIVDPNNETGDIKVSNNTIEFQKEVFNQGIYPLEPLANWNLDYRKPIIRVINPLDKIHDYIYKFRIFKERDTNSIPVASSETSGDISKFGYYIEWNPKTVLLQGKTYWLTVSSKQLDNQAESPALLIPFHTYNNQTVENVQLKYSNQSAFLEYGTSDNLTIEPKEDSVRIFLTNQPLSYRIASVYGGTIKSPNRDVEISFDGIKYIIGAPEIVGVKIVVISGDSVKVKAVRIYQTYDDISDAESVNRFLRDTVNNNDYVLLGTLGESFRGFRYLKDTNPQSMGSLDTLHSILKNYYGSKTADTINENVGSFSMIARKNNSSFKTNEKISLSKDTALVTGNIIRYEKNGSYITNLLGPAKSWNDIELNTNLATDSKLSFMVIGLNNSTGELDKLMGSDINNNIQDIVINSIDAMTYPYIRLKLSFSRDNENLSSSLMNFIVNFTPVPEFVLSSDSKLVNDTLLRGEEFELSGKVMNISPRTTSLPSKLHIKASSKSKIIEELFVDVPVIKRDDSLEISYKKNTDDYDTENFLNLYLNPNNQVPELYSFNNQLKLNLFLKEDNIRPEIKIKLDGKEVKDGDFVAQVPFVEIELLDNSPLPIINPGMIGVGINRPFPSKHDTLFESFGRNTPLKARLSFYSDTLDYGENYYRVFAYDNAGNSDTLLVRVNVAQNGIINNIITYPNPFSTEVNIDFNLGMKVNDGQIVCNIYNAIGQKVRDIISNGTIGKNSVRWDGFDYNGSVVPSGLYTYIIFIKSSTYFEPVKGKMIFMR